MRSTSPRRSRRWPSFQSGPLSRPWRRPDQLHGISHDVDPERGRAVRAGSSERADSGRGRARPVAEKEDRPRRLIGPWRSGGAESLVATLPAACAPRPAELRALSGRAGRASRARGMTCRLLCGVFVLVAAAAHAACYAANKAKRENGAPHLHYNVIGDPHDVTAHEKSRRRCRRPGGAS